MMLNLADGIPKSRVSRYFSIIFERMPHPKQWSNVVGYFGS